MSPTTFPHTLTKEHPTLFKIDTELDLLVKKIELLSYVNPINMEKEKQRFFTSKYIDNPVFSYPKLKFNPFELQRKFFAQPLERIKDSTAQQLYQDIIYYYSNMIQCIEHIGDHKKFYYNSLRVYGTPTEKDVHNAQFILHFADEKTELRTEKYYSSAEAKTYFEQFITHYNFPLKIGYSTSIAANAMVSNRTQTLLIKKNAKFSRNQLLTLANHEIGVHLVTTYNGLAQPLKIFSNGFPKNVETQEGLAVFSEYMCGSLTLNRLKELAYRVIASDSLIKDFSFSDTFHLLHNYYKLNRDDAFTITLRAHRGGGFTKDRLYLSGLRKIYKRYLQAEPMVALLSGKVAMEYEAAIMHLKDMGLVTENSHQNKAFSQNLNTNKTLDFILNNLK
ncbi:flavohemoglobin expression-modulating QEGLA motif protein [Arenibacter sp. GZD96]|uniref:flavohemoglobin expression-modulating QEGLA motif protein n=1 Tax=Aurantibrevibacter litoralis TaxID=3106030 RepID=UPI002AFEC544|nr:flavohemoglobin expression-modulating QEGLA motif protein [Arenibacter sp. GZD-96]MEA1785401.1 flavohemoglobin expression-modulating QEGLA motif protein [Arenibacter sp. GZD-96]